MSKQTPTGASGFDALIGEEALAIDARRAVAFASALATGESAAALPTVGVALSGGGIRSATFSLGLLRGIASNGLLPRIDYLSTVSGGGFTGGMLGRLIASIGSARAQDALARPDSLVMWWLRRNGRYLTPAGSRDLGMAVVTYLRAWVAVHLEFAFVALLVGVLVMLPHLVQNESGLFHGDTWSSWPSAWWPIALAIWLVTAPGTMLAYWIARDAQDTRAGKAGRAAGPSLSDHVVFVALCAVLAYIAFKLGQTFGQPQRPHAGVSAGALVFALLAGATARYASVLWRLRRKRGDAVAEVAGERNRLTRVLRRWTLIAAALAGIGLLDIVSWKTLELVTSWGHDQSGWLVGSIGIGGIALAVLRAFAEPIQKLDSAASASRFDWRSRVLNALGIALGLLLLLLWVTLTQWFVFYDESGGWSEPLRVAALLIVALLWFALTAAHGETANASSLHSFYRARLTRAYLSVGNPTRFSPTGNAREGSSSVAPDERTGEAALDDVSSVTDVLAGDDIALGDYRPEINGGPIHLVNTCLNQTRDDNSDLYNADRKGCMLTVSARGFEWGRRDYRPIAAGEDFGTLGRWIAISGAAAAPGAGSYTSSGWAMTLFFLGVRLGYWLRNPVAAESAPDATPAARFDAWRWRRLAKPRLLLSEARARYRGTRQPWWYLSDGGHFENTAVYPLLRRRLDFIILADAGADPRFELGDLENLVRKARIDFGAEIEFYVGKDAEACCGFEQGELSILSPEDLAGNTSARGVLLGRIRYADAGPGHPAKTGTLLVVKPNLHTALDADLLGYALRNPEFPQQATGDQFFDEAQWESYQRLGFDFGRAMENDWLAKVPGWSRAISLTAPVARLRKPERQAAKPAVADAPFWRRSLPAAALGTTLGIGASTTLLLAAWQAIDQIRKERDGRIAQTTARIEKAEALLDTLDRSATSTVAFAPARVIGRQVGELLELKSPRLDPAINRRIDLALAAFAVHCNGSEPITAQTGSLCGVAIPIVQTSPLQYWSPSCRSTVERPFDLRACPPDAGPGAIAIASAVLPSVAAATEIPRVAEARVAGAPPVTAPVLPARDVAVVTQAADPPPVAAATGASAQAARCLAGGVTLYTQVYDEPSRLAVIARWRTLPLGGAESKQVPPVENVVRSAQLKGIAAPSRWRQPTLIVHDPADRACAEALRSRIVADLLAPGLRVDIRPLPAALKSTRRVIELWLPPDSVVAGQAR